MPRKRIHRQIHSFPMTRGMVPKHVKWDEEKTSITLNLDEAEAMRLKDLEDMSQEAAAKLMGISRQTFQNVLDSGRKKVTGAIWQGYTIEIINEGNIMTCCDMHCQTCGHHYKMKNEQDRLHCPVCSSRQVVCVGDEDCRRWC